MTARNPGKNTRPKQSPTTPKPSTGGQSSDEPLEVAAPQITRVASGVQRENSNNRRLLLFAESPPAFSAKRTVGVALGHSSTWGTASQRVLGTQPTPHKSEGSLDPVGPQKLLAQGSNPGLHAPRRAFNQLHHDALDALAAASFLRSETRFFALADRLQLESPARPRTKRSQTPGYQWPLSLVDSDYMLALRYLGWTRGRVANHWLVCRGRSDLVAGGAPPPTLRRQRQRVGVAVLRQRRENTSGFGLLRPVLYVLGTLSEILRLNGGRDKWGRRGQTHAFACERATAFARPNWRRRIGAQKAPEGAESSGTAQIFLRSDPTCNKKLGRLHSCAKLPGRFSLGEVEIGRDSSGGPAKTLSD
ncbi:uncharacterized protein B0H18DRAFT_956884 [Fomitopsis serialis]|uniref:uncharacterized protein n=1 Tax=Fomitopsis serialis TaxID=139415 RepID=UPI0020072469|nr:uncharacterized protein B0H18DRAFT_956884 [Neoantrodia serialis]KAH9920747.1 hypothetical protein B0H18DRAFT_956884 [Neoantrodia serialis]